MNKLRLWAWITLASGIVIFIVGVSMGDSGAALGGMAVLLLIAAIVLWVTVAIRRGRQRSSRARAETNSAITPAPPVAHADPTSPTKDQPKLKPTAQRASRSTARPLGRGRKPLYVTISYRELTSDQPANADHGYCFEWKLPETPVDGMRVWVSGGDGRSEPAVIAAVGVKPPAGFDGGIKPVRRVATAAEIERAGAKVIAAKRSWLNMARRAAELPVAGRVRTSPPEGYPEIPPADGEATAHEAGEYGRVWWRVFKAAETADWPKEEVQRVRSIAHRWYAIRDRGN